MSKRNKKTKTQETLTETSEGIFVEDKGEYDTSKDVILEALRKMPKLTKEDEIPCTPEYREKIRQNRIAIGWPPDIE